MLWVETGLKVPTERLIEKAKQASASFVHIPVLEVESLKPAVDISSFEAAFVGSPRAAQYAVELLKTFTGNLFAVGQGTQDALKKLGFDSKTFASDNNDGAYAFLTSLSSENDGKIPYSQIAWISAEETAADLSFLTELFKVKIVQIPVYRTFPSEIAEKKLLALESPKIIIVRSGKAAKAILNVLTQEDSIVAYGTSTKKALNEFEISYIDGDSW